MTFWNATLSNVTAVEKQELHEALEDALSSILESTDGTATVKTVSIREDASTSPPSLLAEFQVDLQTECFSEDCNDPSLSDELLVAFKEAIDNALSSGALSAALEKHGAQQIAPELRSMSVDRDQSPLVRFSFRVRESDEAIIPKVVSAGYEWRVATGLGLSFFMLVMGTL